MCQMCPPSCIHKPSHLKGVQHWRLTPWRQLIREFLADLYVWNVRGCADVLGFDAFICLSHGAVRDEGQICGFLPRSLCPSPACTRAGSRAVSSSPCCVAFLAEPGQAEKSQDRPCSFSPSGKAGIPRGPQPSCARLVSICLEKSHEKGHQSSLWGQLCDAPLGMPAIFGGLKGYCHLVVTTGHPRLLSPEKLVPPSRLLKCVHACHVSPWKREDAS